MITIVINVGFNQIGAPKSRRVSVNGYRWTLIAEATALGTVEPEPLIWDDSIIRVPPYKTILLECAGALREAKPVRYGEIHDEFLNTGGQASYAQFAAKYGLLMYGLGHVSWHDKVYRTDKPLLEMSFEEAEEALCAHQSSFNPLELYENVYSRTKILERCLCYSGYRDAIRKMKHYCLRAGKWDYRSLEDCAGACDIGLDGKLSFVPVPKPQEELNDIAFEQYFTKQTYAHLKSAGCTETFRPDCDGAITHPTSLSAAVLMSVYVRGYGMGSTLACANPRCSNLFKRKSGRKLYCRGYCRTAAYRERKKEL